MRVLGAAFAVFVGGVAVLAGCAPSSTPSYPAPDFQAAAGDPFLLRAGELALVPIPGDFLYVSVQTIGIDSRCPPDTECAEPGHLLLTLELEDSNRQGAVQLRIPPDGASVATFGAFEIRSLRVEPPGRPSRILPTDYILVLQVTAR